MDLTKKSCIQTTIIARAKQLSDGETPRCYAELLETSKFQENIVFVDVSHPLKIIME